MLGRNRIVEKIGEGGMGTVYRAKDVHLGRDVAIKILPPGTLGDKSARRLFQKEALTLSRLNHPTIETLHDFDTQDGIDYLVIEYIAGTTLGEILREKPLTEKETTRLGLQLIDGLAAAHDLGVVHCDLKPNNLMITPDGRLKILDFGLAKLFRPVTTEEATTSSSDQIKARGTLPYMAPEQLKGERVDQRTDIYAFGDILYQMITGRLPFQESLPTALANDILTKSPPPPGRLRPDLSQRLEEIILKCLEKDPENRYQSAKEIAVDLRRLPGYETSRAEVVREERGGRRTWLLVAIGPAIVAAGFLAWLLIKGGDGRGVKPDFDSKLIRNAERWEGEPAISPDGKWVVFVSYQNGHKDILMAESDGRSTTPLTNDEANDSEPAWFPDSKTIAFTREEDGKSGIYRVGLFNDTPTLLLPDAWHPAISRDGTKVAFYMNQRGNLAEIGVGVFARGSQDISEVTMLTATRERFGRHLDPTWSRDGKMICYAGRDGLRSVQAKAGASPSLIAAGTFDYDPCWSPVSDRIYFSSQRGGILSLWYVNAKGGNAQRLTDGHGQESHPSISSDGRLLMHAADMSRRSLMLLDRKSGKPPQQVPELDWDYGAIAPGGKSIVCARNLPGSPMNLWEQKIVNGLPDDRPYQVQSGPGYALLPAYSPDGAWIAYQYTLGERTDIYLIPSGGGQANRITNTGTFNGQPAWSPAGNEIVFRSDRSASYQLWAIRAENGKSVGEARQLTDGDYDVSVPAWSPSGRKIAFLGHKGRDLHWMNADRSSRPEILAKGIQAMWLRWIGSSEELLISAQWDKRRMGLWTLDPKTGNRRPFPAGVDFGGPNAMAFFDISWDGNLLLYSREDVKGGLWMLSARSKPF